MFKWKKVVKKEKKGERGKGEGEGEGLFPHHNP